MQIRKTKLPLASLIIGVCGIINVVCCNIKKSKTRSVNGEAGIVGDREEIIHHDQLQHTTDDGAHNSHEEEVAHTNVNKWEQCAQCQRLV